MQEKTEKLKQTSGSSPVFYLWLVLLVVLLLAGLYGAYRVYTKGQITLALVSTEHIEWSPLIATYVFFVVSSTGLCLVASIGHVFGYSKFKLIGRRAIFLAIVTLLSGFIAIGIDLGHPLNLFNLLFTPNLGSAIFWMGFFYSFYLVFMIIELWFLCRADFIGLGMTETGIKKSIYRLLALFTKNVSAKALERDEKWAKRVGFLGVIAAISAHSTLGAVFGHVESRALWWGDYAPVYFILTALIGGAAFITLFTVLTYRAKKTALSSDEQSVIVSIGKIMIILFIIDLLFIFGWKIGTALSTPEKKAAVDVLLTGQLSTNFWLGEILIGIILPIVIILYSVQRKNIAGLTFASFLTLLGLYVLRYDWVLGGQLTPGVEYIIPKTLALIVLLAFVFCLLVYTLGEKYLPLSEKHAHGLVET